MSQKGFHHSHGKHGMSQNALSAVLNRRLIERKIWDRFKRLIANVFLFQCSSQIRFERSMWYQTREREDKERFSKNFHPDLGVKVLLKGCRRSVCRFATLLFSQMIERRREEKQNKRCLWTEKKVLWNEIFELSRQTLCFAASSWVKLRNAAKVWQKVYQVEIPVSQTFLFQIFVSCLQNNSIEEEAWRQFAMFKKRGEDDLIASHFEPPIRKQYSSIKP